MREFINLIKSGFQEENYPYIVFVVIVGVFFKANAIFKFYNNIKNNKLNFLFDLEKKSFLDESTKESIQEAINNDVFRVTTGIRTNKYMREKIIDLYKEKKGEVTLFEIRNAMSFLKIKNGSLVIELKTQDKILSIFNFIFGFITLSLGIILTMFFSKIGSSIQDMVTNFFIGVLLIFITFPILLEVRAYKTAKRLEKILN